MASTPVHKYYKQNQFLSTVKDILMKLNGMYHIPCGAMKTMYFSFLVKTVYAEGLAILNSFIQH